MGVLEGRTEKEGSWLAGLEVFAEGFHFGEGVLVAGTVGGGYAWWSRSMASAVMLLAAMVWADIW